MDSTHEVELNFFYLHYNDAKKLLERAKEAEQEHSPLCSLHARHSIISTVFASEALINRVIFEFAVEKDIFESLEKLSIQDKWFISSLLCRDKDWDVVTFDKGNEPFQSFNELIKIRNWLLHPKVEVYIAATCDHSSTVGIEGKEESYPWMETLKSNVWPQTKFPKNPFELSSYHAQTALSILDAMISKLKSFLRGKLYDGWLEEISIRDKNGLHFFKAPIQTLWEGYRPKD